MRMSDRRVADSYIASLRVSDRRVADPYFASLHVSDREVAESSAQVRTSNWRQVEVRMVRFSPRRNSSDDALATNP